MKKKVLLAIGIASLMLSMMPVGIAAAQKEESTHNQKTNFLTQARVVFVLE